MPPAATIEVGALLRLLDDEWNGACEHNRNPAVCETCRTYDNVIDAVVGLTGGDPGASIPAETCSAEHPQVSGWHCDVERNTAHDTHEATLYGIARYRWSA